MSETLKPQQAKRFVTPQQWNTDFATKPYFHHLQALFPLDEFTDYPEVSDLNTWADSANLSFYRFLEDAQAQEYNPQGLYYEQFIFEKQLIPTRKDNWHDLFNAIIWCLFPQSKSALNKIHIKEIQAHGLNPRSPVRNRVTHFDECGGILVYQNDCHLAALQQHRWHDAFCHQAGLWGKSTALYVFGHANYEMLLAPYIGLTGKYLPVQVTADFWQLTLQQQYRYLDNTLLQCIKQGDVFQKKGHIKPIPLLGIPGWWPQQDQAFYNNTEYFRPKK